MAEPHLGHDHRRARIRRAASLMTVPEHCIAIAVATNVSGAENPSLLSARLADAFVRLRQAC